LKIILEFVLATELGLLVDLRALRIETINLGLDREVIESDRFVRNHRLKDNKFEIDYFAKTILL
jgi:hypothetical protein